MAERDFFEHAFGHLEPSTPKQAEEIFERVAELTTIQGRQISDAATFGRVPVVLPEAISEHLPSAETEPNRTAQGLYVVQELDQLTGIPINDGVLAHVSFSQSEHINRETSYSTQVEYHVSTSPEGSLTLERHIKTQPTGKAAEDDIRYTIQTLLDSSFEDALALQKAEWNIEPFDELSRIEASLGFYAVTYSEAQSISDTLDLFL